MQPTDWSQTRWRQRFLSLGLVVLLVGTAFASVAAADAAIGFENADVSATTVTVGENVTVSATAVNVGDSGGGETFVFEHNGTDLGTGWVQFDRQRVTIPASENRTVTSTVRFDEPGTYKVRVNNERAGIVRVKSARARLASETDSQRRIDIKASGVSTTASTEFDIPPSNRSVALQRWSTTTGQSAFQQYLTEYTNRSEAPGPLPTSDQSTLLGVVAFESEDEFRDGTMRIAVDGSVLANSTLDSSAVSIYQRDGAAWERLETDVVADEGTRTVYEATATRGTTYAVGRMDAAISLANTSYRSAPTATGQRLFVEAQLRNSGPIAGSYVSSMQVNGEEVNRTTVTVPAGSDRTVTLSHEVTEAGSYTLELNGTTVGSVLVTGGQVGSSQSTEATAAGPAAGTATGMPASDDGVVPDAVPSTILGVQTLYVAGGLAIALGVFVVILLLLRRGGDGGGGRPDSFDPF